MKEVIGQVGCSSTEAVSKPGPNQSGLIVPVKKAPCLFCGAEMILNKSLVTSVERRKLLCNLYFHMHLDLGRVPMECSEEAFPLCEFCLPLLKGMWNEQQSIDLATSAISGFARKIEEAVRDSEVSKKTLPQQGSSSTAIEEQHRSPGMRAMIIEGYRKKISKRQGVQEDDDVPSSDTESVSVDSEMAGFDPFAVKMEVAEEVEIIDTAATTVSIPIIKTEFELASGPPKNRKVKEAPGQASKAKPQTRKAREERSKKKYEDFGFVDCPEGFHCTKCTFTLKPKDFKGKRQITLAAAMKRHILCAHKSIPLSNSTERVKVLPKRVNIESLGNSKSRSTGMTRIADNSRSISASVVDKFGKKSAVNVTVKRISKTRTEQVKKDGGGMKPKNISDSLQCAVCDLQLRKKCGYISHFKTHRRQRPKAFKVEAIEEDPLQPPSSSFFSVPKGKSIIIPLCRSEVTKYFNKKVTVSTSAGIIVRDGGIVRFAREDGRSIFN